MEVTGLLQRSKEGVIGVTKQRTGCSLLQLSSKHLDTWKKMEGNQKLLELHLAVESGSGCVMVQGESGCGKSTLLKTYAHINGYKDGETLFVIHLGEQVDGKMMLGTFTCSAVPGEFEWVAGILTKSVIAGHWIILEDIDSAPSDVISLLLPLIKNRQLMIPGYYDQMQASPEFKLFLTRRVVKDGFKVIGSQNGLFRILENWCSLFHLPPLSSNEVEQIISSNFPDIDHLNEKLANAVIDLKVSLRHVLKLCQRISSQVMNGRLTSVPDMMLEIIDCFAAHLPCSKKVDFAMKFSHLCGGLSYDMVDQLCSSHKPSVKISPTTVTVGRAYLHRKSTQDFRECYAHTQASLSLLEAVCRCVQMGEPVLLVGETGVGKTSTVSYMTRLTGNKLVVMNMSQQTDSTDLLGGYKPVQLSCIVAPLREQFENIFHSTFSAKNNAQFLASVQACFVKKKWKKLLKLMLHSMESAKKRLKGRDVNLYLQWQTLGKNLKKLQQQILKSRAFAFAFEEGALIEAVKNGWWILLDEVNLASPETLQTLCSVLEADDTSLLFLERADSKPVERHPNFRLFCCMNPSTDVGKKSLPDSIKNRFTEFLVDEPQSTSDLRLIVISYLKNDSPSAILVEGIVSLYRSLKQLSDTKLLDGTGRKPHFSLRNLCRALHYAACHMCGTFYQSLYEVLKVLNGCIEKWISFLQGKGFCMTFLTEVCQDQHHVIVAEIQKYLALEDKVLSAMPSVPPGNGSMVQVEGFWLEVGSEQPTLPDEYVITPSVKRNLRNLARVVSSRRYPVLLQGPTSAGKTSLIQYLARATGHRCLRINNHEHTDLQEYVGMYTADINGELVFREGVLVEAMKKGYWVILDELNLAPTDVLEALNRVLDDNRELFIPETREMVKAHSHFILFGTQNPPGLYRGRKVLSRAFRNRFIELHYNDIPSDELVNILQEKCELPSSYAKKMVALMKDLQERRTSSGVFAGKYGLITLRDLFRWAERYRRSNITEQFWDWEQHLAEEGFMVLAGRLRDIADEQVVLDVIEKYFKRSVQPCKLFGQDGGEGSLASHDSLKLLQRALPQNFSHLVWTAQLLRMGVLAHRAILFDEPILLVGQTGCGKTTLCQLLAALLGRKLLSINCHMHTEAADFLGGLKPTRNRTDTDREEKPGLFEWQDGIVVQAMQKGCCLLIDEISLAEDAVLERLNSLLERERKLLLSEKSCTMHGEVFEITAAEGFTFMATMNPGGDYGKKELSASLRNRFLEIWSPSTHEDKDLQMIVQHNLKKQIEPGVLWSRIMIDMVQMMKTILTSSMCVFSVRDILSWVAFMNTTSPPLTASEAFYHGAHLVCLDSLGCSKAVTAVERHRMWEVLEDYLQKLLQSHGLGPIKSSALTHCVENDTKQFGVHPFFIEIGPHVCQPLQTYSLSAPGPCKNAFKLLRGMQLGKPLLIEGPPGVGKTSLVTAIAQASGHAITRINLSEHTDISDLFGSDLPVEGSKGIRFAWRDGPLMKALKNGEWVLLDEINLASQSVLEGLNATLDHRGEVFIPELGKVFPVQIGTRFFACQNPMQQGGGRKGLPKSFLNRFTMVYIDVLSSDDLLFITSTLFPNITKTLLEKMIKFNSKVEAFVQGEYGTSLWEFNLRDILRWCQLMQENEISDPGQFVDLIYCRRLRSASLRFKVLQLYSEVFGEQEPLPSLLGSYFHVSKDTLQVGQCVLSRKLNSNTVTDFLLPLHCQLPIMEALMTCVEKSWMAILVGSSCSGKNSAVHTLAQLCGYKLVEFPMNTDTDTSELLGGFQQVNFRRKCSNIASLILDVVVCLMTELAGEGGDGLLKCSGEIQAIETTLRTIQSPLSVVEENSTENILRCCLQLKECLVKLEIISSALQTSLCNEFENTMLELSVLTNQVKDGDYAGQFEWVDSILVRALKYGHWLFISNANLCSPSVLDRLNPLLEPGGVLNIDERGIVSGEVISVTPHPNFRLFLLMDPAQGEISRAMRNRGIEIFMLPEDTLSSAQHHIADWKAILSLSGLPHDDLVHFMELYFSGEEVNPTKYLQALKCHCALHNVKAFSNELVEYRYLDIPQFHMQSVQHSGYNVTSAEQFTVSEYCLQPEDMGAMRDISSVLLCLNRQMPISMDKRETYAQRLALRATLKVFSSHATQSDYPVRAKLLTELSALLEPTHWTTTEIRACIALMDTFSGNNSKIKLQRGTVKFDLGNIIAICNPITASLPENMQKVMYLDGKKSLLRGSLRYLQELLVSYCEAAYSGLKTSHMAHIGHLQLENLIHPSQVHIQPFFSAAFHGLDTFLSSVSSHEDMEKAENIIEWLSVLLCSFANPVHSLSDVAALWTTTKKKCVIDLLSLLTGVAISRSMRALRVHLDGLAGLETITQQSQFLASFRETLNLEDVSLSHSIEQKGVPSSTYFSVLSSSSKEGSITIGDYSHKLQHLQCLQNFLWVQCCSLASSPLTNIQRRFNIESRALQRTLAALSQAISQSEGLQYHESNNELLSLYQVSVLCNQAKLLCPDCGNSYWEQLKIHILKTNEELARVGEYLFDQSAFSVNTAIAGELDILCSLSRSMVHLGVVLSQLLLPSSVDPVHVASIYYQCHYHMVLQQNTLVEACDSHYHAVAGLSVEQLLSVQSQDTTKSLPGVRGGVPPYIMSVIKRKQMYEDNMLDITPVYQTGDRSQYNNLVAVCSDLLKTLCSPSRLRQLLEDAKEADAMSMFRVSSWKKAVASALDKISSEFSSLPDIVHPFIMGLKEMISGVSSLASIESAIKSENFHLSPVIRDLAQFPYFTSSGYGTLAWAGALQDNLHSIIRVEANPQMKQFYKGMIMVGVRTYLSYLSSINTYGYIPKRWLTKCASLLELCWSQWVKALEAAQAKAIEEESLYRYRTKTHIITDGEATDEGVLRELFPIYDSVFEDGLKEEGGDSEEFEEGSGIENGVVDGRVQGVEEESGVICGFSNEQLEEIASLHLLLFSKGQYRSFVISADECGYSLAATLTDVIGPVPGLCTDYSLYGAHARKCHRLLHKLCEEPTIDTSSRIQKNFNIYKHSLTSEAKRVQPVVHSIKSRVEELLVEWPDNPVLNQVARACDKVLSLDIREPLMKLLAALEYILRKAQDWEAHAATHVSLCSQLEALTKVILDWRRLELNSWKNLLPMCSDEVKMLSARWWFHLNSLCRESITEDKENLNKLITSVQLFMETASLGEFSSRLTILDAFSADMSNKGHHLLASVLLNTFLFYQQFLAPIQSHIDKQTLPIEKEFNKYVSIMRWNDGNYWALKSSTEKCHRSLVKFMKKWKSVLNQPVQPLLSESLLISDEGRKEKILLSEDREESFLKSLIKSLASTFPMRLVDLKDTQQAVLRDTVVTIFDSQLASQEGPLKLMEDDICEKMERLLKEFSCSTVYQQWNVTVDEIVGEIINSLQQLQSMDFLKGLEGNKRKQAVTLRSTQKRKAIAELFKNLKQQGLSCRMGVDINVDMKCKIFKLPVPQNLNSSQQLWSDIQKYFYRCVARLAELQVAYINPTKDLPSAQLISCKGYASHLMTLSCQQRTMLANATSTTTTLQQLLYCVKSVVNDEVYSTQTASYDHWQTTLLYSFEACLEAVSNFSELVSSMPEQNTNSSSTQEEMPPIIACEDNHIATGALSILTAQVPMLEVQYKNFLMIEKKWTHHHHFFVTVGEMDDINEGLSVLETFFKKLLDVLDATVGSRRTNLGIFEFLQTLYVQLSTTWKQCIEWMKAKTSPPPYSAEADKKKDLSLSCSVLTKELILSVQRVMTRHRAVQSDREKNKDVDVCSELPCCWLLHSTAMDNLKDMRSEKVLKQLIEILYGVKENTKEKASRCLLLVYPLLHHYVNLQERLALNLAISNRTFCKLLSVLLSIFSSLVAKGLCIPPDIEHVEGEWNTEFVDLEGGGLDDGQGTKNVSKEVEPSSLEEPTLEHSGQDEENTADPTAKEEEEKNEDTIDMTEDFGGATEDLPQEKEGEQGEENKEKEEDYDKEMGELGNENDEQIDRNLWAPEEQQEQSENELKNSVEQGSGANVENETRIVAKEDLVEEAPDLKPHNEETHEEGEEVDENTAQTNQLEGQAESELLEDPTLKEHEDMPDIENLEMESDIEDGGGESATMTDEGEKEIEEIDMEEERVEEEEQAKFEQQSTTEDGFHDQEVEVSAVQSTEANTQYGDMAIRSDDQLPFNSPADVPQEEMQESQGSEGIEPTKTSEQKTNDKYSSRSISMGRNNQVKVKCSHRMHPRPQTEYTLAEQEETAIKRPKLMEARPERDQTTTSIGQEYEYISLQSLHHIKDGSASYDAVVWDAAPPSCQPGTIPPSEYPSMEDDWEEDKEGTETGKKEEESDLEKELQVGFKKRLESEVLTRDKMDAENYKDNIVISASCYRTEMESQNFFVSGNLNFTDGRSGQMDEEKLRQSLKNMVQVLHSAEKSADASQMWRKYQALVSPLSNSLFEELRLALQPMKAAQLKGDFRTGKRLNMRRIIPYIASYFQNDHIWLRRVKPSQRDYQLLIAVDDSASMNENGCNQMAYESLAMISSALSRLECGQLGIARFGANAQLLHSFDQPFSAVNGGHVLEHLSFTQNKTNFVELLQMAHALFAKSLTLKKSQSSSTISQLLLILSDGRGVFADGTHIIEVAIRTLNDLGVLTVFVILDNQSTGSVLKIKVPSFISGKAPIIHSYLETFPFPFYIVLQDIKSLPIVLGKALCQWFELLSEY